jgi:hypothetical protein
MKKNTNATKSWNYTRIEELCAEALEAMRDALPVWLYQEACDLIEKHGEYGIAMEYVIDWIGESGITITAEQMSKIEIAMTAMALQDSDRLRWLRTYCQNDTLPKAGCNQ